MFSRLSLTSLLCVYLSLATGKPLDDARTGVREHDTQMTHDVTVTAGQEVKRSRRSLTALLAAEVLFLERILAAQQAKTTEPGGRAAGRKPRKIAAPRPHAHFNTLDTRTKSKPPRPQAQVSPPPVQVFRFGPPVPAPISRAPASTASLDPFVMLKAPDLSQNSYGEYEVYQTPTRNIPAPLASVTSSRGQVSHLVAEPEIEIITAPPVLVSDTFSVGQPETRQKRKLHYGAFELYQL